MTSIHTFSNELPGNWRLLGEIELPADPPAGEYIYAWLVDMLHPLGLNDRFLKKILASAELAAAQNPSTSVEPAPGHVHLLIYTPVDSPSNGQSWGFFRVEKKGDPQLAEPNHDHAIAFYLYREGI